mmetsp:Transcript_11930/g.24227  ORF Transcript_11930/g.24227 Transcript_11930/m.24227 type:complete len:261 (+) Transcript_11930:866-1648(+)
MQPHAHPAVRLLVHAEQLPPGVWRGGGGLRSVDLDAGKRRLGEELLAEGSDPILLDHPHQPRLLPVLAVALVTEDAQRGHAERTRGRERRGHPNVNRHRLGDALDGHVATEDNVEAHLARRRVRARLEADVVDVGVRKVVTVARDADVELPRQVAVYWVAALAGGLVECYQIVEHVAKRARVDHLVLVDAGKRVAHHVTNVVEPRHNAGLVKGVKAIDHGGSVLQCDPSQLDVLARGDVNYAHVWTIGLHGLGVEAHLIR